MFGTWLASSVFSTWASAEPSAEERAVAAELFEQATIAEAREAWGECVSALTDAVTMVETPGLRFHLAYCKEQQQRWVEALVDYKRAAEMIHQGVAASDVSELLPEAIHRLERDLPRLTLTLREVPSSATLFVDGLRRSPSLFGKPIPLDPGSRKVEVLSPGHAPFRSEVILLPRERRSLDVVLVPDKPEPKAVEEVAPAPVRDEPLIGPRGWVLLSEGVVSAGTLGLGLYFSALAEVHEADRKTLVTAIDDPGGCYGSTADPRCEKLRTATRNSDDARAYATAAYITSGVAASALIATWMFWPSSDDVALRAAVEPRGAAVSVNGRF